MDLTTESESHVKWEDPPPAPNGNYQQGKMKRAAMLKNSGKWLVWNESASSGQAWHLRSRGFEITCRGIPGTKRMKIYARWPENKDPAEYLSGGHP